MNPTELQALLDREGVPVEARAKLYLRQTPFGRGESVDLWYDKLNAPVVESLAELAHVGAMVRWLESKVAGGIEIKSLAHEGGEVFFHVIFSIGWDEQDCKALTLTEAIAHACGRIAKEKGAEP